MKKYCIGVKNLYGCKKMFCMGGKRFLDHSLNSFVKFNIIEELHFLNYLPKALHLDGMLAFEDIVLYL